MPRFLGGLFENKAAVSASSAVNRAISGSIAAQAGFYYGLQTSVGQWDMEYAVQHGLEKVIWVFRCVDVIATNQAKLNMVVRRDNPETGEIVKDDRLNKLLNRKPNGYESAFKFRYRLSAQLLLSRKGAFVEIVPANDGKPAELHLLPPQKVNPVPDPKKFVKKYIIQGADYTQYELPPERVIWITAKPHPTDPYLQETPMVAAGIAADIDYYSRLFNRNFIVNDGRPGMLVAVRGRLLPEHAENLKARFSGGPTIAGQTTVIEADGLDVKDMTSNPRDVQWLEGIRGSKEDILLSFGVPESVMGNASGRTFDNADAEREGFWVDTEQSHCSVISSAFEPLTGSIEDELYMGWDYSSIDVLQRRIKEKHDKAMAEFNASLITIDEYREITGRKTWNVAGTRALYMGNNLVVVQDEADIETIKAYPVIGAPPAIPGPADQIANSRRGAEIGARQGMRQLANILAARAIALPAGKSNGNGIEHKSDVIELGPDDYEEIEEVPEKKEHPYANLRANLEGKVEGILTAWSDRQDAVVQDRLMHTKVRKNTRHWTGEGSGTKALDTSYVIEAADWANEAAQSIAKMLTPIIRKQANRYARDLRDNGVLDEMRRDGRITNADNPLTAILGGGPANVKATLDNVLDEVLDIVHNAAANQSRKVAERIQDLDDEGLSLEEIKREVSRLIGRRSSWRKQLGIYVTTAAVEGTKQVVYGKAAGYMTKTWQTMLDERVRASHNVLDSQTKAAGSVFKTPHGPIRYPGDPLANISETANCRCWLEFAAAEVTA